MEDRRDKDTEDHACFQQVQRVKLNLMGFNDDAWAPRHDANPLATLAPTKAATSAPSPPPPPPPTQQQPSISPPAPTVPSPEEIQAAEAERQQEIEDGKCRILVGLMFIAKFVCWVGHPCFTS